MSNENGSVVSSRNSKKGLTESQLSVDYSEPYPRTYSNIARVANGNHDMSIDFGILGTPQDITENDPNAKIKVRVVSQVFVPHGMVSSLIAILFKHLTPEERIEAHEAISKVEKQLEISDNDKGENNAAVSSD